MIPSSCGCGYAGPLYAGARHAIYSGCIFSVCPRAFRLVAGKIFLPKSRDYVPLCFPPKTSLSEGKETCNSTTVFKVAHPCKRLYRSATQVGRASVGGAAFGPCATCGLLRARLARLAKEMPSVVIAIAVSRRGGGGGGVSLVCRCDPMWS